MFIHTFACAHTDIPQWLYSEALALVKGHLVGHRCRLKYESLLFVLLQKCMRERFVWVWWSQTGNTMHLFKSQQPKMHPTGKWACLHLEVWALLYSLRLPQPPGSCSPASGLRLPRPPGMAGALSCSAALPSHSSGLGKFQWPGLKTSSAFLTVDCGFGSTLENLDLLQSNISWAWMLEKARAPWSGSYPMGTWMVLGLTGLRVWWCADNSWPGLMRFFMQVWDRMLGE